MDDKVATTDICAAVLRASHQMHRLALFGNVLADEVSRHFIDLLDLLASGSTGKKVDDGGLASTYCRVFALLAEEVELSHEPVVGDAWQNHILGRLLADENPLSKKARLAGAASVGTATRQMAASELRALQSLAALDTDGICNLIQHVLRSFNGKHVADWLVPWRGLTPLQPDPLDVGSAIATTKAALLEARDWGSQVDGLLAYYETGSTGVFARFRAFRWVRDEGEGRLVGIAFPDRVRLTDLIAYEPERVLLLRNTEQFMAGYPANNVLLYGDRGTGKSSTVKALLNEYARRGLRLIEVPRHLLSEYPEIVAAIRERRERFILFVDDLSFDEHETGYKDLKAILEGGVEARPDNLLLYATSNRRHLVQERFADRLTAANDDEIHSADTAQESLSLSDRFGITITFLAPDQRRFLRIVRELAAQRRLPIEEEELRARAITWAARHNGRSGRTARQFVDHLTGELSADDTLVDR